MNHILERPMAMAEEESETSVAASSSTGNWWNAVSSENPNSVCSWNEANLNAWPSDHRSPNGTQNSGAEDNVSTSINNTSNNNSTLTMESTDRHLGRQDLVEPHASLLNSTVHDTQETPGGVPDSDHIWSQFLLCVNGGNEGAQSLMQTPVGNLYQVLSSRALRTEQLEVPDQAVQHLRKMEENVPMCWEFTHPTSFHGEDLSLSSIEKQVPSLHYNGQLLDDRLQLSNNYASSLSDLVSGWSIAPPDHQDHDHNPIIPRGNNISLNTFNSHGLEFPTFPHFEVSGRINNIKQEICDPVSYGGHLHNPNTTLFQDFGSEINQKNDIMFSHPHILDSANNKPFRKSIACDGSGCSQMGSAGDHRHYHHHQQQQDHNYPGRWQSGSRSSANVITFGSSCTQNKQMLDFPSSKPVIRHQSRAITSHGNEGARDSNSDQRTKKSRSTENPSTSGDTVFKRPRLESNSSNSTVKVSKVKLGDRITALQQLVSPFGKTDTASVLLEAIGYIKFLQEQVQVLSTPYMKAGMSNQRDQKGWKDSKEPRQDLKSRGLCLVPLSFTMHVSSENSTDYWTPSLGGSYR